MEIPDAIMIRKKPFATRCPACSKTFDIGAYEGSNGPEKLDKMVADYEAHFKATHAKEAGS